MEASREQMGGRGIPYGASPRSDGAWKLHESRWEGACSLWSYARDRHGFRVHAKTEETAKNC